MQDKFKTSRRQSCFLRFGRVFREYKWAPASGYLGGSAVLKAGGTRIIIKS